MTIREYIDFLPEDEADEISATLFALYEDDYDDFASWAIENGIDLDATAVVGGEAIPVLTLWAWDACGD